MMLPPPKGAMRVIGRLLLLILITQDPLVYCAHAQNSLTAARKADMTAKPGADGFIKLFNGRDLTGWKGLKNYWSVKDGSIRGLENKETSRQTFLILTTPRVTDFELHFKYRLMSPEGNSGVQFRSQILNSNTYLVGGYQADFDSKVQFDGSIYDEAGTAGIAALSAIAVKRPSGVLR